MLSASFKNLNPFYSPSFGLFSNLNRMLVKPITVSCKSTQFQPLLKSVAVLSMVFFQFLYSPAIYAAESTQVKTSPKQKITMVFARGNKDIDGNWVQLIYHEAFKRMGIELIVKVYPLKRCSYLSDAGKVDGELWRVHSYNQNHPNLVRVEECSGPL